jgi:dienelactone hydrolase
MMTLSSRCRVLFAATVALSATATAAPARAQENVRQIPPPGIAVPEADRTELTAGVAALGKKIDALRADLKNKRDLLSYLPDVEIYHKAVSYALTYNEFFKPAEIEAAKKLLAQGNERADALRAGQTPWMKQAGLVALGYVSRIDGSIQPYGLVVPESGVAAGQRKPHRLDIFCHGRGETLSEVSFIDQRQRSPGEFQPPGAFVLHPYGRYCNANRFAGEVDVFEALADVRRRYPVDNDRIVMRGFSMGGASAWQFATHHSDQWVAASPGAGFSETAEFSGALRPGRPAPPWYEQKLWRWYDSTEYAVNLTQCPTVAYNGDQDGQKQAADRMQDALKAEGMTLTRVIGLNTGHRYTPEGKAEIEKFVLPYVEKGRERVPKRIRFTTFTLRYNRMNWLVVGGLERHWERARVDAELTEPLKVALKTENVSDIFLDQKLLRGMPQTTIDGQTVGRGWRFRKENGKWRVVNAQAVAGLRKTHGLQGPIDDAFMDRFVMVRPTGRAQNETVGAWTQAEMAHATKAWRDQFRADAPVKDDAAVTKEDIRDANLVLWGDPSSNKVLARIADKLPVRWNKDGSVKVGSKTYPAGTSVPVFIYPNPLNPSRYVVLNSGITWREHAYLNNSYQTAKLPDWAVVDITTPPDARIPGRIADAGFFDESWRLQSGPAQTTSVR